MAAELRPLTAHPALRDALAGLLIETVAGGGSVGFMHPLAPDAAQKFWESALADAEAGGRVVLGAWVDGVLAGTVSLLLALPPNQPHRAEIAKMMVAPAYRRQGLASLLLHEAEEEARRRGRRVLVLDTAAIGGAAPFYERHGYVFAGEIPHYALLPRGGLTATRLYWKILDAPVPGAAG